MIFSRQLLARLLADSMQEQSLFTIPARGRHLSDLHLIDKISTTPRTHRVRRTATVAFVLKQIIISYPSSLHDAWKAILLPTFAQQDSSTMHLVSYGLGIALVLGTIVSSKLTPITTGEHGSFENGTAKQAFIEDLVSQMTLPEMGTSDAIMLRRNRADTRQ